MTAQVFVEKCIGCEWCISVCPHQIIILDENKKAEIVNEADCIECGACALNCPTDAILTHPLGCGCVGGVLKTKFQKFFRIKPKNRSGCS